MNISLGKYEKLGTFQKSRNKAFFLIVPMWGYLRKVGLFGVEYFQRKYNIICRKELKIYIMNQFYKKLGL